MSGSASAGSADGPAGQTAGRSGGPGGQAGGQAGVLREPVGPVATQGRVRLRVRYCECDPMGVVHHSSYVPWLEMGRTELLRASGVSYADFERAGIYLVITRLECAYRAPSRYDDELVVHTRVLGATRVKIRHGYEVYRVAPEGGAGWEQLVLTAETTLACVGADGKVRALPGWLAGE